MHRPWHTLIFGALVFSALGLLGTLFPGDSVSLGSLTLRFFKMDQISGPEPVPVAATEAIEAIERLDTSLAAESKPIDSTAGRRIHMNDPSALKDFFSALETLAKGNELIRVLHYGDSQIEADRISDYLRLKLQGRFGGTGTGLLSLTPLSPGMINRFEQGPGWDRYTVFTVKDPRVAHNNFGVMAGFSRFVGYRRVYDTTAILSASMQVTTTKAGGPAAMQYSKLKLFYGGAQVPIWCQLFDGPALISADSLKAGGDLQVKTFPLPRGSNVHRLQFTGKDSPDFYALSLEGDRGIMVDNIPLRGSSGTFFHQISQAQMRAFFSYLNVKLIILQFGGNAMPAIKDATGAYNYGTYIKYQLSVLKKLAPGVSILFVGPSDMSYKDGTVYKTLPFLEETRDAIRKTVLESGCAFFDMYECMGGRNSMPVWVDKKLAATDYTHFSPQGARKIAITLYTALMDAYSAHRKMK